MVSYTSNDIFVGKLKRQLSTDTRFGSDHVPLKYKRRKLFAVRDFPDAFDEVSKTDCVGDLDDDFIEPFELDVEFQENTVLTVMDIIDSKRSESGLKMSPYTLPKIHFPRRKVVSAVRDFPKVFEQFSRRVNSISNSTSTSVGTVHTSLDKKVIIEFKPFESNIGFQENVTYNEMKDFSENLESDMDSSKVTTMIEGNVLDDRAQAREVDRQSSLKMRPEICFPQKRVSAIRSYPPGCGRNARPLSMEDSMNALVSSKSEDLSDIKQVTVEAEVEDANRGNSGDEVQPKAIKKETQFANSAKLEHIDSTEKCVQPIEGVGMGMLEVQI